MSGEIVVVGMGPGPEKYLTLEARKLLLGTPEIFFRFSGHPVYAWLEDRGKTCHSFEYLYTQRGATYNRIYRTIDEVLIKSAQKFDRVVYALPGNPYVFEVTPHWLKQMAEPAGVSVRIVAGLSFLEQLYIDLEGFTKILATLYVPPIRHPWEWAAKSKTGGTKATEAEIGRKPATRRTPVEKAGAQRPNAEASRRASGRRATVDGRAAGGTKKTAEWAAASRSSARRGR